MIIGGEIMPDNDPRAIRARAGSSTGGGSGGNNANASSSSAFQGAAYTMQGGAYRPPPVPAPAPSTSTSRTAGGPGFSFLDEASEALGIKGRTVWVPALPFLGLSASQVN